MTENGLQADVAFLVSESPVEDLGLRFHFQLHYQRRELKHMKKEI